MVHGNPSSFAVRILTATLAMIALGLVGPTLARAEKPKAPTAAEPTKAAGLTEIQVTLFGQPCLMNGPFPRSTLTLLHEISPERIPPTANIDQMKKIRSKVVQLTGVPLPIEQYRDHLKKRLSAKIAFEEALIPAKKTKTTNPVESKKVLDTFLKNVKENISTLQFASFEESSKKALEANGYAWNGAFIDPLRERYEGVIQPETQEEFHKAIRLSQVQYVCSFDEGDDHSGKDEGEE